MASSRVELSLPAEWLQKYEAFCKLHEESYRAVERGLTLEQHGRLQEAISSYETGITLIDKALSLYLENVAHPSWDKYVESNQKMRTTKKEILSRLCDLQNNTNAINGAASAPPSYEEAMQGSMSSPYSNLNNALNELKVETGGTSGEVLYVQDNVRMYFISPNGHVGSLSDPASLTIAQIQDGNQGEQKPRYYLQIGEWIYPLLPGLSPILHSEFGAFIIPDVHSPVEGSAVGLVLPQDADSSVYEILDDILQGIVQQAGSVRLPRQTTPPRPPPPLASTSTQPESGVSHKISQGLITGAQYLSYGLVKGAEKAGELMNHGTPKVIAKIQPDAEPKPIPPTVRKSMKVAKDVTGTAAQVTCYVANKVGLATMALGRFLAPHVQCQGTRLLSSLSGLSEQEAAHRMEGALEVTAGAVQGVGTVYNALENSASILAHSLANNTVQIVQHKYGQPAGEVTGDTLYAVGNVVTAGHNVGSLTIKGIAKRTAKDTGKAVIEDYQKTKYAEKKEKDDQDGAGPSGM